jgi:hypothetical protein
MSSSRPLARHTHSSTPGTEHNAYDKGGASAASRESIFIMRRLDHVAPAEESAPDKESRVCSPVKVVTTDPFAPIM